MINRQSIRAISTKKTSQEELDWLLIPEPLVQAAQVVLSQEGQH
jgi:hypothetical protein